MKKDKETITRRNNYSPIIKLKIQHFFKSKRIVLKKLSELQENSKRQFSKIRKIHDQNEIKNRNDSKEPNRKFGAE